MIPDQHEQSLFVGPFNWAGQDRAWAEAVTRELGVRAVCFAGTAPRTRKLTGNPHLLVPHHRLRPQWIRRMWLTAVLRGATHLLLDGLAPLRTGGAVMTPAEIGYWQQRGTNLAAVFHGTEIRSPDRHMQRLTHSHMNQMSPEALREMQAATDARRRAVLDSGVPMFVSTPDLLIDLPSARWLPLVVEQARWSTDRPALAGRRLRVLHVPSSRKPPVKGSAVVDAVLADLHAAGAIEYVCPTSPIPHSAMPDLVKSVDVVVDQILVGSYGVAAVESMAAGRLTVGYVADDVRALMPADPPIVDAPPDRFAEQVRAIAADPGAHADVARRGPGFAAAWHDGRAAAAALADFVGVPQPDQSGAR